MNSVVERCLIHPMFALTYIFPIVYYCRKSGWRVSLFSKESGPKAKGSIKYSAAKLYEKGVILEIEGLPTNQYVDMIKCDAHSPHIHISILSHICICLLTHPHRHTPTHTPWLPHTHTHTPPLLTHPPRHTPTHTPWLPHPHTPLCSHTHTDTHPHTPLGFHAHMLSTLQSHDQ